jgi:hypothetical protein
MSDKYYVVCGPECPGHECDDWGEAAGIVKEENARGNRDARIILPESHLLDEPIFNVFHDIF